MNLMDNITNDFEGRFMLLEEDTDELVCYIDSRKMFDSRKNRSIQERKCSHIPLAYLMVNMIIVIKL